MTSLVGTWIQVTALSWLVWELTGEKDKLGAVDFAARIPNLFLPIVAGILADRFSRHKLVILTQMLAMSQAAALAALALSGHITFFWIIPLAIFIGVVTSFDMPIRQSFYIELVDRDALPNAVALNAFAFNTARIVGPMIAGWLLSIISAGICFLINALSYALVLGALFAVKTRPMIQRQHHPSPIHNFMEAAKFTARHVALRDILLYLGMTSFTALPFHSMLPAVAEENLNASEKGFSYMLSAIGVGALLGAATLSTGRVNRHLDKAIPTAGFCFGIGLLLFSTSNNLFYSLALLVPTGACMMAQTLSTNMFIQKHVPDKLRGRIMSIYSVMLLGMWPIGSLVVGFLAEQFGTYPIVRVGALISIGGALVIFARNRKINISAAELLVEEKRIYDDESGAIKAE